MSAQERDARLLVEWMRCGISSDNPPAKLTQDEIEKYVHEFAADYGVEYPWDMLADLDSEMFPDADPLEAGA